MKNQTRILISIILLLTFNSISGISDIQSSNKKTGNDAGFWDSATLGNHRVVVRVSYEADAVWVHIPWRRRDPDPEKKNIVIINAESGEQIKNLYRVHIDQAYSELVFQPQTVPGEYYIYYMPYKISGQRFSPTLSYLEPEETPDSEWLKKNGLVSKISAFEKRHDFPLAEVVEFQSIDKFNSFSSMENIATESEIKELLAQNPKMEYLLFPEDRKDPIRMTDHIPMKWHKSGPKKSFEGEAALGEFYVFQIGIYAVSKSINNLKLRFENLKGNGFKIPSSAFTCFNIRGATPYSLPKGKIGALWCGVQIPKNANPGIYEGKINILPEEMKKNKIRIRLDVKDTMLEDKGDSEPWRHSHLRWLDSKIAQNSEIIAPFTPLRVDERTMNCLGRSVTLGVNGLPENIQSFFALDITGLSEQPQELLASPIKLAVESSEKNHMPWENREFKFIRTNDDSITWESKNQSDSIQMICRGQMEFDGYIDYQIVIQAKETVDLKDIRLEIPISREVAKYMMGMGKKGGIRPSEYIWNWDPLKNQNSAWIGDVNAGLQLKLKRSNRSLASRTPNDSPLSYALPQAWHNEGKGGCDFREIDDSTFLIKAFTGPRTLRSGEELHLHFHLLITPLKTLDLTSHWSTRLVHRYLRTGLVSRITANVINLPQSTRLTPYINYPFLNTEPLKEYVEQAHSNNLKVIIEHTEDQFSNHAPEIFALKSLGNEVFKDGPGGGVSWLQEHLGSGYKAGRYVPLNNDATIQTVAHTRWDNYYLESIDWIMKNLKVDGLFLDNPQFGRQAMKRLRKILDQNREDALIDLHAMNKFTEESGFANSANLYLELFPYVDRIWFGQNYDYEEQHDYWLVEISGIPFGLTGDILQRGDNTWRGMLYGMSPRHSPGSGNPRELWRIWDRFGIQDSKMFGYWVHDSPIKSNHKDVPATVYVKKDKVLIVLASWSNEPLSLNLKYDWNALGMKVEESELQILPMDSLQNQFTFENPTDIINVRAGKGWLMLLQKKTR